MKSLGKSVFWVLLLAAAVFVGRYLYFEPDVIRGERAPDFSAVSPGGDTFRLSDLNDRYVLLDFWASWCAPCRRKNPELVDLYRDYKDVSFIDAEGFTIVSYALETGRNDWLEAIEEDGLAWPWQGATFKRFDAPVPEQYGIRSIPTTLLLNPGLEVAGVNLSVEELRDRLDERVKD